LKESNSEQTIVALEEALKRDIHALKVPENKEIYLSPQKSAFGNHIAQIEIRKYKDLQVIGYAPHELSQDKIDDAIVNDNEESYKIANILDNSIKNDCSCNRNISNKTSPSNFEDIYRNIRKRSNFSLAKLFSKHYDRPILPDDPAPNRLRKLVTKLKNTVLAGPAVIFEDITIESKGVLTLDPDIILLFARDIWIHRTGRLVSRGMNLNIIANSIKLFSANNDIRLSRVQPFWRLKK
jgi:hypothetical protein